MHQQQPLHLLLPQLEASHKVEGRNLPRGSGSSSSSGSGTIIIVISSNELLLPHLHKCPQIVPCSALPYPALPLPIVVLVLPLRGQAATQQVQGILSLLLHFSADFLRQMIQLKKAK